MGDENVWKVCNICKTPIHYGKQYYLCSVSTCRRNRTQFHFCSVACFDAHLPMMRHRDAWAEQENAPTKQAAADLAAEVQAKMAASDGSQTKPQRRVVGAQAGSQGDPSDSDSEVLIVVSKLKKFIKNRSGMSTSDTVMPVLSEHLRKVSVASLRIAAEDGRKTVMDRDVVQAIARLEGSADRS